MGGSWPRPRRLKDSWEYLYRDGGGERGAGGVCRGKSYQENHGGAVAPTTFLAFVDAFAAPMCAWNLREAAGFFVSSVSLSSAGIVLSLVAIL